MIFYKLLRLLIEDLLVKAAKDMSGVFEGYNYHFETK